MFALNVDLHKSEDSVSKTETGNSSCASLMEGNPTPKIENSLMNLFDLVLELSVNKIDEALGVEESGNNEELQSNERHFQLWMLFN